jgi:hypothetical protein
MNIKRVNVLKVSRRQSQVTKSKFLKLRIIFDYYQFRSKEEVTV